jgi:3-methyladenine DNA glycosylase Tag
MSESTRFYDHAKTVITAAGYGPEIEWQAAKRFESVTEEEFLSQLAWVVLASGMKESIVRAKYPGVSSSFFEWDISEIMAHGEACALASLHSFGHRGKIYAILDGAEKVNREGWDHLKIRISKNPIKVLQEFKFIGPITVYHLAKNLGLDVAKPDRHLVRIAAAFGYSDVQRFCRDISEEVGDSVPVVDIVLWRYATIAPNYLEVIKSHFI